MLRAIAGIIVGYLIFAVPSFLLFRLTHVDPHAPASLSFEFIAVVYGIFFAFLGGYIGAAVGRKLWVSIAITIIIATGAVFSILATGINWSWSPIAALIFMVPAAFSGGWWRMRHHAINGKALKK